MQQDFRKSKGQCLLKGRVFGTKAVASTRDGDHSVALGVTNNRKTS